MTRSDRRRAGSGRDETGASLLLALGFLLIVSGVVAMLTGWATNDLKNTHQFSDVRLVHLTETDALNLDLSIVRATPTACSSTPFTYTATANSPAVDVWCSNAADPESTVSRTVTFWSCLASVSSATCQLSTAPISINAVVEFNDYTAGVHVPSLVPCTLNCGTGMTITKWTVI